LLALSWKKEEKKEEEEKAPLMVWYQHPQPPGTTEGNVVQVAVVLIDEKGEITTTNIYLT
jgi:hypothetical protein